MQTHNTNNQMGCVSSKERISNGSVESNPPMNFHRGSGNSVAPNERQSHWQIRQGNAHWRIPSSELPITLIQALQQNPSHEKRQSI
jgi:hypothetical protein